MVLFFQVTTFDEPELFKLQVVRIHINKFTREMNVAQNITLKSLDKTFIRKKMVPVRFIVTSNTHLYIYTYSDSYSNNLLQLHLVIYEETFVTIFLHDSI